MIEVHEVFYNDGCYSSTKVAINPTNIVSCKEMYNYICNGEVKSIITLDNGTTIQCRETYSEIMELIKRKQWYDDLRETI